MSRSSLEIKELGLVLVGKFNPAIIHPQWLVRKELISEGMAGAANLKINHSDVSEFDLEFCTIQVFLDRFSITSQQETQFSRVRDLAIGVFECLSESPVFQLGINLHHHYKFENQDDYMAFGHKVVPKDTLWGEQLKNPGLSQITIQGERTDSYNGKKIVTVQISNKVKVYGVEVRLNDHFDLYKKEEKDEIDTSRALKIIKEEYDNSFNESSKIISEIYEYGIAS